MSEEAAQELASADMMRDKLSEHIIYLQNEIRKRDELLEEDSDFGGDDECNDASDS